MKSLRLQSSPLVRPGAAAGGERRWHTLNRRPAARPLLQQAAIRTSRRTTLVAPVRAASQGPSSGRSPDGGSSRVLRLAQEEAFSLGHSNCGTEHLVLGLLCEGGAASKVLRDAGVTLPAARAAAEELFGRGKGLAFVDIGEDGQPVLPLGPDTKAVLLRAEQQGTLSTAGFSCGGVHLLAALLSPVDGESWYKGLQLLRALGVDLEHLRKEAVQVMEATPLVNPDAANAMKPCATKPESSVGSNASTGGSNSGRTDKASNLKTSRSTSQEEASSAGHAKESDAEMDALRQGPIKVIKSLQLNVAAWWRAPSSPTADCRSQVAELEAALEEAGKILERKEREGVPTDLAETLAYSGAMRLVEEVSVAMNASYLSGGGAVEPALFVMRDGSPLWTRAGVQKIIRVSQDLVAVARTPPSTAAWRSKAAELEAAVEELGRALEQSEGASEAEPIGFAEDLKLDKVAIIESELHDAMSLSSPSDDGEESSADVYVYVDAESRAKLHESLKVLRSMVVSRGDFPATTAYKSKVLELEAAVEEALKIVTLNERKASEGRILQEDERMERDAMRKVTTLLAEVEGPLVVGHFGQQLCDAMRQELCDAMSTSPNDSATVGLKDLETQHAQMLESIKFLHMFVAAASGPYSTAACKSKLEAALEDPAFQSMLRVTGFRPFDTEELAAMVDTVVTDGFDSQLHVAADRGDLEGIGAALAAGEDVNAPGVDGRTPLHCAARCGSVECIQALLSAGADLRATSKTGSHPTHWAAFFNRVEAVRALLAAGAPLDPRDNFGSTPLMVAAEESSVETVKLLLSLGADVNARNTTAGITALHIAALMGTPALIEALVAGGADIAAAATAPASQGITPLHCAAGWGNTAAIRVLTAAGADVLIKDKLCRRPLHLAAVQGGPEAVMALLGAGRAQEQLKARNGWGGTPLHAAADNNKVEAIKLLVAAGADLAARNDYGLTPWQSALQRRQREAVSVLMEAGKPRQ